jgi:putative ABC transport system permease protein
MFNNYLKSAFRSIQKRKGYSILNIAGLAIGMTCCLLIFHYVSFERSYDKFQPDAGNIYRVQLHQYEKGTLAFRSATSYPAIGPAMKNEFPEVAKFCRLMDNSILLVNEQQDKKFSENKGYYADSTAIQMFGMHLIKGDAQNALNGPDKIILSETTARKYFGAEDPLGKTLLVRNRPFQELLQVAGVYKDLPSNSHLILQYLVSYATLNKELHLLNSADNSAETSWNWYDFYVYIQLKPEADVEHLEAKMPAFCETHVNSRTYNKENSKKTELHLIPLNKIHLYSNVNQEAEVNGNGQAVAALFLIAIIIICIAWINYINLSTARSIERAKEVGVKKVLGSSRAGLIKQFFFETMLLNLVALAVSLIALLILIIPFNHFTEIETGFLFTLTGDYWLLFASLFITGALLSGFYPALVLSGFKPVTVLKGAFKRSAGGLALRKGLIIAQFATSVVLIAGTIIIYQQVNYMQSQHIGADIDQTIVLKGPQSLRDSTYQNEFQPFKSTVLKQAGVQHITASSDVIGNEIYWTNGIKRIGAENTTYLNMYHIGIDVNFIPAYSIEMLAGRNFSEGFGTDQKAAIINETAVKQLGFKDAASAIDQKVKRGNDSLTIIGVTANFHQLGLQKAVDPMIFILRPNVRTFYSVKVQGHNWQKTIASLKDLWGAYFPSDPFDYFFLDQSYFEQYKADHLFGKIFGSFAFIAIFIACFGLLGLSAYNIYQRTKEIGVRKVLGASAQSIFMLLAKDFIRLILFSFAIAVPIAWYVMNKWLQDYYFRIDIAWWVFIVAGVTALVIVLSTISIQVIKAVAANPVKDLKTE